MTDDSTHTKKTPFFSFQGIGRALKKKSDSFVKNYKEESEYKSQLNAKLKTARREAFEKEAIRQARLRAELNAKMKFSPKPKAQTQPMFYDPLKTQTQQQQFVKQVVKRKLSKKKKKRSQPSRVVTRVVQQQAPKNNFNEMLWKL